jgi:aminopeptidase-like protein
LTGVLEFALERREQALGELRDSLQDSIDREAVAPYLGAYTHPVLGDITLAWEDNALMLDAGEFEFEIRSRLDDGNVEYLTFTPPVEGIPVELGEDEAGNPRLVFGIGVVEYTFERIE